MPISKKSKVLQEEIMQTVVGAKKVVETMVKKHGSYEKWCMYMRENGSKGGKKTGMKGFALNKELAISAGRKGGKISKRGKKLRSES